MFQYKKYHIKNTDSFKPDDFPKVQDELDNIKNGLAKIPGIHSTDIIISFLKDPSFKKTLLGTNPALAGLFGSDSLVTTHLESLFDSCSTNNSFLSDYEEYVRKGIS